MISTDRLYAYRLEPQVKPAIWGGDALVAAYGKPGDPSTAMGESWECWDENRVENGAFAGATLGDLRRDLGADLMGPLDRTHLFPVLTKIIDARAPLSVQVHPDDAYARRVEHQLNGKTECWHILAAQPGAELVLGWTRDTDRAEYERRVADGTLGDILRRVPVAAGETYFLPAGTLHAIGAGIQLFETQQASDLTYRIFDWNRVGADGQPRQLHVAKAGDVLDYRATTRAAVEPLAFTDAGSVRTLLVGDRRFVVERVRVSAAGATIVTHGLPVTITALSTPLDVEVGTQALRLAAYATIVIPAAAETCAVRTASELLVVRPSPALDVLANEAVSGGVSSAEVERFLGQFA